MNKKTKESIAVIGEGITEYYFFNSVKDEYRQLNLKPTYPKHASSLKDLEKEVGKAIDMEYSRIFCVIDMDNKKARVIDLPKYNLFAEPEGIDIYNRSIIVSFPNKPLYCINIQE